ncbi:MAG: hypothetical protein ACFNMD_03090, partial [Prevotella sp.]
DVRRPPYNGCDGRRTHVRRPWYDRTAAADKPAFRRLKVDIPVVRGQYSGCQNVALHRHEI